MSKMRLDYLGMDQMYAALNGLTDQYSFKVTGERKGDYLRADDEFCKAYHVLKELGVHLDLSTNMMDEKYCQKQGYDYSVLQMVFIKVKDAPLLGSIRTGGCTLAQAICLWLLMKYGENLEGYEAIQRMYEVNCKELGEFLDQR